MIYPKSYEQKVGFNDIRTILKGRCLSTLGSEEVDKMAFMNDVDDINEALKQVSELKNILDADDGFPCDNFIDMREALMRIQIKGSYFDEPELFSLKSSLKVVADIVEFIDRVSIDSDNDDYVALKRLTADVHLFPNIISEIDKIINQYGKIKDTASPELYKVRNELTHTKKSITISLRSILSDAKQEGYVEQDVSPTMREGRLVIPVSPSFKRRIKGIVHDESASGKTVFIEPTEVVELNNKVRVLEIEEQRIIITILQNITNYIRPYSNNILDSYKFLGKIDFIRTKVLFAERSGGIVPAICNKPIIDWVEARHPVLENALKKQGRKIVPLDITLTPEDRILLISGPNAGGKSVCLKTVGLLQYMVQCGLPIPLKENSKVGIFESIFIDIGDEQSIENDLSTYSSHLLNMKHMMKNTSEDSLILIDELGSGTEPLIGAALAEAILGKLLLKQTFGIITTHYQNLKYFADNNDGIVNGAMLYDRGEMKPLFSLQIGQPGSSFAIEIARAIGLPGDIIEKASLIVGKDYIQSDKYLQDIVRDKRYWENKRSNVHQKERQLTQLIDKYETNIKELSSERDEMLHKAKEQAAALIDESRAKIENTIRVIREEQAEKEKTKQVRQELENYQADIEKKIAQKEKSDRIDRKMEQIRQRQERREKRKLEKMNSNNSVANAVPTSGSNITSDNTTRPAIDNSVSSLQSGMYVKIKGQQGIGVIEKVYGNRAIVQVGSMHFAYKQDQLEPTQAPKEEERPTVSFISRQTRESIYDKKLNFKPEIDIRGQNGEEALQTVTYFIEDAILLGVTHLRILHGTGTGFLRTVVRQYLNTVPNVKTFHDEHVQLGGAGITVIELE